MNRFKGNGLYLLDEPEAALSPNGQLAALLRIHELVEGGSQFVIATHSPIILAYPHAHIYQLDEEAGISEIEYTQTEHYLVTRSFLNDHHRMLHRILKAD